MALEIAKLQVHSCSKEVVRIRASEVALVGDVVREPGWFADLKDAFVGCKDWILALRRKRNEMLHGSGSQRSRIDTPGHRHYLELARIQSTGEVHRHLHLHHRKQMVQVKARAQGEQVGEAIYAQATMSVVVIVGSIAAETDA